jgi:ubiquinone/menaquinone biosynthesis C-methylase UbiE
VIAEAFDATYGDRLEAPERLAALPPERVVALLRLTGEETVVDYGAGTGVYTVAFAEALPRGTVFAVEALPQLVERLRARMPAEVAGRVRIVETAANSVPVADGVADRLVLVDVLHHLHDQPSALSEMLRLLRPGGWLVAVDWSDQERPFGPPPGHALGLQAARAVLSGAGLRELEAHEAGELFPYHLAIIAERP